MSHDVNKDLEGTVQKFIKSGKTKFGDREFLFVFPIIGQVVAANRSIDILIKEKESACLGLICRQIFEMLVSLEYVFYNYNLKHKQFYDFCKYFTEQGRIGRYDKKKKQWVNASIDALCDKYIKYSKNKNVKECYDALCQMTHFSLMHTKETLLAKGRTLEINLSGVREESPKICEMANIARTELTRLITEAIQREYLKEENSR